MKIDIIDITTRLRCKRILKQKTIMEPSVNGKRPAENERGGAALIVPVPNEYQNAFWHPGRKRKSAILFLVCLAATGALAAYLFKGAADTVNRPGLGQVADIPMPDYFPKDILPEAHAKVLQRKTVASDGTEWYFYTYVTNKPEAANISYYHNYLNYHNWFHTVTEIAEKTVTLTSYQDPKKIKIIIDRDGAQNPATITIEVAANSPFYAPGP